MTLNQAKIARRIFLTITLTLLAWGIFYAGQHFAWIGFQDKTLWDWLQLAGTLAIPVVVGGLGITYQASQRELRTSENLDNQRETALQKYLDDMAALLIDKKLLNSKKPDVIRNIARVQTLTVLEKCDPARRVTILQFLYEARLISKDDPIIDLHGANLKDITIDKANLRGACLSGANLTNATLWWADLSETYLDDTIFQNAQLSGANFINADLNGAYLCYAKLQAVKFNGARLSGTDLSWTDLTKADFTDTSLSGYQQRAHYRMIYANGAEFREANLTGAIITTEQLKEAGDLEGATLPDGTKAYQK